MRMPPALACFLVLAAYAVAQPRLDPGLLPRLENETSVRVLVHLAAPPPGHSLAAWQESVLAKIPPGGFRVRYRYRHLPLLAGEVTVPGLRALVLDSRVAAVGPDRAIRVALGETAALIRATAVHQLGFTGRGVIVAVVDTGVDTDHPDLQDDLAPGAYHFLGGGRNTGPGAEDDHGHGTMVAGIITGAGQVAPPGIAPQARILAIKVLDRNGQGWVSDQVAALDYLVGRARSDPSLAVVNMSLGTNAAYGTCGCDNADAATRALSAAVGRLWQEGVAVIAAAGNGGRTGAMPAPACIRQVISVGGTYDAFFSRVRWAPCTDRNVQPDSVCCITDRLAGCLDLLGPAFSLTVPALGGGKATAAGGTSFAAPHAAAVAALLREALPRLTPTGLLQALQAGGKAVTVPGLAQAVPRVDALGSFATLPQVVPAGSVRVGRLARFTLTGGPAGKAYVAGAALHTSPPLPLPGGGAVALAPDPLFFASQTLPAVFQGFRGTLDATGSASVRIQVPAAPFLAGFTAFLAYVAYDGTGILAVSWPRRVTVQP